MQQREDVVAGRAWLIGAATLAGVAVVQFAWHVLLNVEATPTRLLRDLHLHTAFEQRFGKPTIAPFVDLVAPAFVAAVAFGNGARPRTRRSVAVFAVPAGVAIGGLQVAYAAVANFDIWWLPTESGPRLRYVLRTSVFPFVVTGAVTWIFYMVASGRVAELVRPRGDATCSSRRRGVRFSWGPMRSSRPTEVPRWMSRDNVPWWAQLLIVVVAAWVARTAGEFVAASRRFSAKDCGSSSGSRTCG